MKHLKTTLINPSEMILHDTLQRKKHLKACEVMVRKTSPSLHHQTRWTANIAWLNILYESKYVNITTLRQLQIELITSCYQSNKPHWGKIMATSCNFPETDLCLAYYVLKNIAQMFVFSCYGLWIMSVTISVQRTKDKNKQTSKQTNRV